MIGFEYIYTAKVTQVYDADSITVDIDLGFGIIMHSQKIRLYGIDAPELRGEEREDGLKARDYLREKILGKEIVIKTIKDKKGKYGRWLGEVFLHDNNINSLLVENNFAVYRDY